MASRYNTLSVDTKYWDGMNTYLHLKWTENRFTPEFSDISELELVAERYENTEQLRAYEQRQNVREENISRINPYFTRRVGKQPYRKEFLSMNLQMEPKPVFDEVYNQAGGCYTKKKRAPAGIYSKEYNWVVSFKREDNGLKNGNKLTQEKRDELRAKNQCFTCKQVGHLAKDFPK